MVGSHCSSQRWWMRLRSGFCPVQSSASTPIQEPQVSLSLSDTCEMTLVFLLHSPSHFLFLTKINEHTKKKRSFINILMSQLALWSTQRHTQIQSPPTIRRADVKKDEVQNCEDVSCPSNHGLYTLICMCYTLLTRVINIPHSLLFSFFCSP